MLVRFSRKCGGCPSAFPGNNSRFVYAAGIRVILMVRDIDWNAVK